MKRFGVLTMHDISMVTSNSLVTSQCLQLVHGLLGDRCIGTRQALCCSTFAAAAAVAKKAAEAAVGEPCQVWFIQFSEVEPVSLASTVCAGSMQLLCHIVVLH